MPYNIVCKFDEKASITFAKTARDALDLVQDRKEAGAIAIDVISTEGAHLPLDRLERIAEREPAEACGALFNG